MSVKLALSDSNTIIFALKHIRYGAINAKFEDGAQHKLVCKGP